ncbi:lipoyl-[GcvH]:protein N-lipoyltransferase [Enterococcus florum]|uniref:Lipoyl-[GcvH]:protein N-lipoyltransferase n=1 Tax=Enterococcus florum TaxID=2480627 RepID=A0A4P5PFH4_9ENTE|nr:lipoate--protein ligase family protein [Enterococcus florum]GCF92213.1 lipoyl-[GcvH]:protein N-lipoyltransferase [Enterococcus florum]
MKKALFFDQGLVPKKELFSPFALTDVLTSFSGENDIPIIHFWQMDQVLILGMKDSRVPHLEEALSTVLKYQYQPILRNAGGLGVISDLGTLNVSLILPKKSVHDLSIDEGYLRMFHWLKQTSFNEWTITAGEIADSYCPGKFDLSIQGKKIAGLAQRRVKNGIAVMMYLSVNGDQDFRGQLVKDFYQAGLKDSFGDLGYPPVRPESMTTLSAVNGKEMSIRQVKEQLLEAMPHSDQTEKLSDFFQTTDFTDRLKKMTQRNMIIQEELDEQL